MENTDKFEDEHGYIDPDGFDTGVTKEEWINALRRDLGAAIATLDDAYGEAVDILEQLAAAGFNVTYYLQ